MAGTKEKETKTTKKATKSAEEKVTLKKETKTTAVKKECSKKATKKAEKVVAEGKETKKTKSKKVVAEELVQNPVLEVEKTAVETPAVEEIKEQESKKILYVASESQPFCGTGGLADIICGLPKFVKSCEPNFDIRVVLPLYKGISEDYKKDFKYIGNKYIKVSWRTEYAGVFEYKNEESGIVYYFIDNEKYFKRDGYYGYDDDGERFAFFSRAVLEVLPIMDFYPDIIHVNDWQTALVPTYLKTLFWPDERYGRIRTVLNMHNVQYQGRYGIELIQDVVGVDKKHTSLLEYQGDVNYLKSAIVTADKLVAVSPSYSEEVKYTDSGCGLSKIIKQNEYKLKGILNGLDYNFYNPETDNVINKNYGVDSFEVRKENKRKLQEDFGLDVNDDVPMLAIVTRMAKHKGLDLIKECLEKLIIEDNIQIVGVGEGDKEYHDYFNYLNNKFPKQCHISLGFSLEIGKKIYSAADIFLMPSLVEPCGLSQMIASRYGCVPIVRETGGLKDSIKDFGCLEGGNGYTFTNYKVEDLVYSIKRAIKDFYDKESWKEKIKIVMQVDFSWNKTAKEYIEIYNNL